MCGTCPRELLSTCACSHADETRDRIRVQIARGESAQSIIDGYVAEYGSASLAIPPNTGGMRAIYMVPLGGIALAGIGLVFLLKRWRKDPPDGPPPPPTGGGKRDAYDDRIDAELKDLDG
jgi:LPXTG-motif cell wall-anchored protein